SKLVVITYLTLDVGNGVGGTFYYIVGNHISAGSAYSFYNVSGGGTVSGNSLTGPNHLVGGVNAYQLDIGYNDVHSGTLLDADPNGIMRKLDSLGIHEKGLRAGRAVVLSSLVAGANHNIDTPYGELIRVTGPNSAFSIGGFQHGEDGRILRLIYTGTSV